VSASSALAQSDRSAISAPNAVLLATQIDSLAKSHKQIAMTLNETVETLKELKTRVNSEMAANLDRIESFKEITNQLFWLFAVLGAVSGILGVIVTFRTTKQQEQLRSDYRSERNFYEERAREYERQQLELHSRVLRIYENQAMIGEKYGKHSDEIFNLQEAYSGGMAKITTTFKEILEDIKGISQFKVEESKFVIDALKQQAEAAQMLPQIQSELNELRRERDERMDDLLQDTTTLSIRSRHEFTEPDRELQATIFQFRIKMDGMSKPFLNKYFDKEHYGPVFYYRGLIAFLDSDILSAHKMLKISERLAPIPDNGPEAMEREPRFRAAFTQFYLALIEKNYGNMRTAKDHIEKSYRIYGQEEKSELLTLVTLAEIHSYLPTGLERAHNALKEVLERAEMKVKAKTLNNTERQYVSRAHLIDGHISYIENKWQEARAAYEKVLEINNRNYYAHYSLGQILQEEGNSQQAQAAFAKALQCLLESKHLETKPERGTQISLNALGYLCVRDTDKMQAQRYRDVVREHLIKVREMDGFELKHFSFKSKRMVAKDEFLNELFE
jgi:tetratricopeptide (TPR) repeat protein